MFSKIWVFYNHGQNYQKNIYAEILMRFWWDFQLPGRKHSKKYILSKYIWKTIKRLHENQYINVLLTNVIPNDIFCIFYSSYACYVCIITLRLQKKTPQETLNFLTPTAF